MAYHISIKHSNQLHTLHSKRSKKLQTYILDRKYTYEEENYAKTYAYQVDLYDVIINFVDM